MPIINKIIEDFHADIMAGRFPSVQAALQKNPELIIALDKENTPAFYCAYLSQQYQILNFLLEFGHQYFATHAEVTADIADHSFALAQYYFLRENYSLARATFKRSEELYNQAIENGTGNKLNTPGILSRLAFTQNQLELIRNDDCVEMYTDLITSDSNQITTLNSTLLDELCRLTAKHYSARSEALQKNAVQLNQLRDFRHALECGYLAAMNDATQAKAYLNLIGEHTETDKDNLKKYDEQLNSCLEAFAKITEQLEAIQELDLSKVEITKLEQAIEITAELTASPTVSDTINNHPPGIDGRIDRLGIWACQQAKTFVSHLWQRVSAPAKSPEPDLTPQAAYSKKRV